MLYYNTNVLDPTKTVYVNKALIFSSGARLLVL